LKRKEKPDMAKRTTSRLELRRQAEAAETSEPGVAKKKAAKEPKKKAATRTKRTKAKVVVRKRMLWGVFSSSLKEEGRFAYAEKEAAEARAAELATKHKRTYFVQPIKEVIADRESAPAAAE
jgi:hypothetical protein